VRPESPAEDRRPFPAPLPRRLGLVCAGGGVTGAIYEIGALAALEERLEGLDFRGFDVYVGVSAGAYLAALIANGITPAVLYRNVTRSAVSRSDIDDLELFRFNLPEIARRFVTAPFTILDVAWDFYKNRHETTLTDLVQSLTVLLPSGVFTGEGLEKWLRTWLSREGRTNDFRKLGKKLLLVAVNLETGKTTRFGSPGHDHVPISKAVAASCAVPGLYKPVQIEGVDYIDGGVKKTAHISRALRERCGLVICVNPIVPMRYAPVHGVLPKLEPNGNALRAGGLATILGQAFRVILHSRMRYGLARYEREAPDSDVLVFEPRPEELPRVMRNIMRTSGRARVAEFAYRSTMRQLDSDFRRYRRLFAKHGLILRPACAIEPLRSGIEAARRRGCTAERLSAHLAALELDLTRLEGPAPVH